MNEKDSGVKCECGGRLKRGFTEVEFFGIDFGVERAKVCADCGSQYLSQETMEEVESEVKREGLFGLQRRGRIEVSEFARDSHPEGNSGVS